MNNSFQPSSITADELLRLNLEIKELHIKKIKAATEDEKQGLEEQIEALMNQITRGEGMPKPPLTSTLSLDRHAPPMSRKVSGDIGAAGGSDSRRPSAVPEKLVQKLIDTGKTREEANDLLKRLSVKKISEEQDVEAFAVYYVQDGKVSETKELLQINAEDEMIYLYGSKGTVFEIRFQDLNASIPLGNKQILLKGSGSQCYELTLENEVNRNNLENLLLEFKSKDVDPIAYSGTLDKKNTLGWRSKDVKLESGLLLYKNKGDKGAYTGLIEIQTPGIGISSVPKTKNQLRITSPTGKQYIFRSSSSKTGIESWLKHLKAAADKAHQISAREVSIAEEKFKNQKISAIQKILIELELDLIESEKVGELRNLISDLINYKFEEARKSTVSRMRNRTSTIIMNEAERSQQGSLDETTQEEEEEPEIAEELPGGDPDPRSYLDQESENEEEFTNFTACNFTPGTVSIRPSNYPRLQVIKSFVRDVTSDNEDEEMPAGGGGSVDDSPTQETQETVPGVQNAQESRNQGVDADKSVVSEHVDTEGEPKSPVDICPSPLVKTAPLYQLPTDASTPAYPKPSEIRLAESLSRTSANKLDEKSEIDKPTTSRIEPPTSENCGSKVEKENPPPVPPSPRKMAPPPPPTGPPGFMGMKLRRPPLQVRQLMWQPIRDNNLSKNGIWAMNEIDVDVDDVMGDEIMQLFKLSNPKAQTKGEQKQSSSSSSAKMQTECGQEVNNSGYTIGPQRAQRLEMLFKRHNISTEFVSDIFMRYFDIEDRTEQGAFLLELKYVQPTELDVEYFKKAKLSFNDRTPITHRQMSLLCDDAHYSDKREILKTITEIEDQGTSIQNNLKSVTEFCQGLLQCHAFKKVLKYILAMGNFINVKNSKEKYTAFSLVETLPKLSETKSTVRPNYTFMHSLAALILKQDPDIFIELDSLDMAGVFIVAQTSEGAKTQSKGLRTRKDPFAMLSAPVKLLSIMYTDAKASIEKMKKASKMNDSNNQFLEKTEAFLTVECHFHLINLKDLAETLSSEYETLLKTFGQDKNTEPGVLFTAIRDFVVELKRAQRSVDKEVVKFKQADNNKQKLAMDLKKQFEERSLSAKNSTEPEQ